MNVLIETDSKLKKKKKKTNTTIQNLKSSLQVSNKRKSLDLENCWCFSTVWLSWEIDADFLTLFERGQNFSWESCQERLKDGWVGVPPRKGEQGLCAGGGVLGNRWDTDKTIVSLGSRGGKERRNRL